MKLIGLAGKARSGKDTALNILQANKGLSIHPYAFAKPIKQGIELMLGIPYEDINGGNKKVDRDKDATRYGCTIRHIMQSLGTEWGRRMINNEVWLIRAQQELNMITRLNSEYGDDNPPYTPPDLFIVSDVRFKNEVDWIHKNGGEVIYISRPDTDIAGSMHSSEQGNIRHLCEYPLINDGTIEEFTEKVLSLVNSIVDTEADNAVK